MGTGKFRRGSGKRGVRFAWNYETISHSHIHVTNHDMLALLREDYAAKHNVSEEDRMAVEEDGNKAVDPMQGLEGLDQAGPKLA